MKWLRYLLLSACVVCLSCADGGPVGTGISPTAAISGNIVDVQTTLAIVARLPAAVALPHIQVSLDGYRDLVTTADSSGNFSLSGSFSGSVTLRFSVPEFEVTQPLDVPAGSAVVLQDIELQPDGVVIQAVRQLQFFGTVDLVDCSDGTLLVHERRAHGSQFLVHLDAQTSIVDADGSARSCAAIRVGDTVTIEGSIAYSTDRTITALAVTIAPLPPPPPPPQLMVRFSGDVAALDCAAGFVVVDDSVQRTTVQLTAQTRLSGDSGALTCAELHLGAGVRGNGFIAMRMPGLIVATDFMVIEPPASGQPLRFMGLVAMIDCAGGTLQLSDDETAVALRLSPATMINGRGGQALTCTDIQPGDRVSGFGRLTPDGDGTLDAAQIMVRHPGPGHPPGQ